MNLWILLMYSDIKYFNPVKVEAFHVLALVHEFYSESLAGLGYYK